MHKACAYTLPVPNAIGNGHLPEDSIGGRGGWGIESRGWVGEGGGGGWWSKTHRRGEGQKVVWVSNDINMSFGSF